MAETRVIRVSELPQGQKKLVKAGDVEILLIHADTGFVAVQSKCPHAGAPLEQGAVCNGRLVCPWHMGTFALPSGDLLEPPPMEPLKVYPVRVDGDDVLVDSEPLPSRAPATQTAGQPTYLLVGTGAAGAMAATTLRQEGFSGRIIAVDPVPEEPVDRTQLSKEALSGKMPLGKIPLGTFDKVQVERTHASVSKLSATSGEATLSDGTRLPFDRALVATGGIPKLLKIPGAELAHVIRHPADVQAILNAVEGKRQVAVIGTSFIALEAASALIQKGLQVTVVGRDALPFAKNFGDEVAQALKSLHERKGTRFRLGCEITSIDSEGVTILDRGAEQHLPADVVILGVGVTPEPDFPHDLPLAQSGGGIAVDATLHAAGNVWVAGDIANVQGQRIEHWRVAQQHGRRAALAMLGKPAPTDSVPFFWTFHFGKRLGYLGHASEWDQIVVDGDLAGLEFLGFYLKDSKVAAILTCGRDTATAQLSEALRSQPTLAEARQAIG